MFAAPQAHDTFDHFRNSSTRAPRKPFVEVLCSATARRVPRCHNSSYFVDVRSMGSRQMRRTSETQRTGRPGGGAVTAACSRDDVPDYLLGSVVLTLVRTWHALASTVADGRLTLASLSSSTKRHPKEPSHGYLAPRRNRSAPDFSAATTRPTQCKHAVRLLDCLL